MAKRYMSIWFRHLSTDWLAIRKPELKNQPCVFASPVHGRMMIVATNSLVEAEGIFAGTPVADAKAIIPAIQVMDEIPSLNFKLLNKLAKWSIRYTPVAAIDAPEGLILDITGCAHLWDGERGYFKEVITRLKAFGYDVRGAIADTVGAARAVARFGKKSPIIDIDKHYEAMLPLPVAALRLDIIILTRLQKLGLYTIGSIIDMPRTVLRRRFGNSLIEELAKVMGNLHEQIMPVHIIPPYHERLPCLEHIRTAAGIEIAIQKLLEMLCLRLYKESKGLRAVTLHVYRIDGKTQHVSIGTNKGTCNMAHLAKLFNLKITEINPGLGIELFVLDATKVEDIDTAQEKLWVNGNTLNNESLTELLDRLTGKTGSNTIHRYLPQQHYWPERSVKQASSLNEKPEIHWPVDRPRPVKLLEQPEPVLVTAPIPDYPPMLFRYKGELHTVKKADGPERIEREWWLDEGQHRDYYQVEDEKGRRYWLFRSGHYTDNPQWFIHGFFA